MRKLSFILVIIALVMSLNGCNGKTNSAVNDEDVAITNKGTHFEVTLKFDGKASHKNIGKKYGAKILKAVPKYESIIDSYLAEYTKNDYAYNLMIKRVSDIKPQVDKEYIDEINGIASNFSGQTQNVRGDGKLSIDETFLLNFFPDAARWTQCSALGVFGDRSQSKDNISMRILGWFEGSQNQVSKLHAVVVFKNSTKSICTIGFLGYMGCISSFNDDKVFSAILDCGTSGDTYSSLSKNSYPFDLRYALENYKTLDEAADYLKSPDRQYAYSHLIFFSDSNVSKILENNVGKGDNCLREVRTEKSELNDCVKWDIKDSIGCVNSFLLKGNRDNHSIYLSNTARYDSMKNELKSKGNELTFDELKTIASYHTGEYPGSPKFGDLYDNRTQQIIVCEPSKIHYEIFFKPSSGRLPKAPLFEKISVSFK